jgi:hypothetical protein
MDRVDFTFKRGGRTQLVTPQQAKVLHRAGLGTYQTRDLARQQIEMKPLVPAQEPQNEPAVSLADGLDELDKEQLHALAKERGVKVHHLAGAEKVRAALRDTPA